MVIYCHQKYIKTTKAKQYYFFYMLNIMKDNFKLLQYITCTS